jgi:hypothetical protein
MRDNLQIINSKNAYLIDDFLSMKSVKRCYSSFLFTFKKNYYGLSYKQY